MREPPAREVVVFVTRPVGLPARSKLLSRIHQFKMHRRQPISCLCQGESAGRCCLYCAPVLGSCVGGDPFSVAVRQKTKHRIRREQRKRAIECGLGRQIRLGPGLPTKPTGILPPHTANLAVFLRRFFFFFFLRFVQFRPENVSTYSEEPTKRP